MSDSIEDKKTVNVGIDIIVPVYRVEKYLGRCIDSILNQTYQNFKLIIVDDGSDDKCPEMCDEYAAKNPDIHVIHKTNGGLSSARNTGIDWAETNSNNEWICFIDSDDLIHPKFLEYLAKAAYENKVDICRCSLKMFSREEDIDWDCGTYNADVLKAENAYLIEGQITNVCAPAKLYRKKLFNGIRYPLGKLHEDLYTTYKLVLKSDYIAVLPNELYLYFFNSESITRSIWNIRRLDEFEAYDEQIKCFRKTKYKKTYINLLIVYIRALGNQYRQIDADKSKVAHCEEYLAMIKRKLKILILKNIVYHFTIFPKSRWGYEIAFPKAMWLYWKLKSMSSK